MSPLKIAIVVQGRFHAFDLARALLAHGHDVTVFTNYPGWAAARFALPAGRVRSFTSHGVASRAASALERRGLLTFPEARLHSSFGRWAAKQLSRERWDVIHCWSGVSEEILSARLKRPTVTLLMRGSAHIAVQRRLLEEEERRTGLVGTPPSEWMVQREIREYQSVDHIAALSTFARESFLLEGVAADRVSTLLLGVEVAAFRPPREVIERRCARIFAGEPLRVVYVGNVSLQKGMWDLATIAAGLRDRPVVFTLVGAVAAEMKSAVARLGQNVRVIGKRSQSELPQAYDDADLFMFPTIQDGYPVVLAQAQASGLPILATTNCSAPDILSEGLDGWILPIRSPDAFVDRLRWCLFNREALADMVRRTYERFLPRDWSEVAIDFEALSRRVIREREAFRPLAAHSVPGRR